MPRPRRRYYKAPPPARENDQVNKELTYSRHTDRMMLNRWTRLQGLLLLPDTTESAEVRRVDCYTKRARWFWQAFEEVEIWALPDGRRVRASRRSGQAWQLAWRPA